MSEFDKNKELARDANGFLNCQLCLRRYLTLVGFENHFKLEHIDVTLNNLEEQEVGICMPKNVFHESIAKHKDRESFEESSSLGITDPEKGKPIKLIECINLSRRKVDTLMISENLTLQQPQKCNKSLNNKRTMKRHILDGNEKKNYEIQILDGHSICGHKKKFDNLLPRM